MTIERDPQGNILIRRTLDEPDELWIERVMAEAVTHKVVYGCDRDNTCWRCEHGWTPAECRQSFENARRFARK